MRRANTLIYKTCNVGYSLVEASASIVRAKKYVNLRLASSSRYAVIPKIAKKIRKTTEPFHYSQSRACIINNQVAATLTDT